MKKILSGIVIIGGIALALPYYGGYKAEKTLRQIAESNSTPEYELTWESYERGWFKSEAKLNLHYNERELFDESLDIPVHVTLKHGPLLFSKIASIGWVQYEANIDENILPAELNEVIQREDEQDLFEGHGYMNLGGDLIFEETVAAFSIESDEISLNVKGATASGTLASNQKLDLTIVIAPIALDAVAESNENITVTTDTITVLMLADYSKVIAKGLLPYQSIIEVKDISVESEEISLKLEGFRSDSEVFFTESNTLLQINSANTVKKLRYQGGEELSDITLNFSYDNIPVALYSAYIDAFTTDAPVDPDKILNEDIIEAAFTHKAGFSISEASVKYDGAPVSLNLKTYLKKSDNFSAAALLQAPPLLISSIVLNAEMDADKSVAQKLLRKQMETAIAAQLALNGADTTISDAELDVILDQTVQQTLQSSLALGYFTEAADGYKATVSFEDGVFKLNDNELPIDALMQAIQ